jgi:23S rRNA (uracil1939-C5)-methyltransferase
VLCVNPKRSKNAAPEEMVVLAGDGEITEHFNRLRVCVSPNTFLQVNTQQAERLYAQAIAYADLTVDDEVLDLYCGTGTLSLLLARHAHRVTGIEVVGASVRDAEVNARNNAIDNVRFLCGDVLEVLPGLIAEGYAPDVVMVNPPRAGVFRSVIERVCAISPRRVVYVSCNPETLARDVVRFQKKGYAPTRIQPVDMFPHTPHVEVVVSLEKR